MIQCIEHQDHIVISDFMDLVSFHTNIKLTTNKNLVEKYINFGNKSCCKHKTETYMLILSI